MSRVSNQRSNSTKSTFDPKKNLEAQRKKFAQETTPTELENMPSNK
jgi:hypothetical protein